MRLNLVLKKKEAQVRICLISTAMLRKQCNIISLNCLDNGLFDMITRFEFKWQQIACA